MRCDRCTMLFLFRLLSRFDFQGLLLNWTPCLASARSFLTLSFSMTSRGFFHCYFSFSCLLLLKTSRSWNFYDFVNCMLKGWLLYLLVWVGEGDLIFSLLFSSTRNVHAFHQLIEGFVDWLFLNRFPPTALQLLLPWALLYSWVSAVFLTPYLE